MEQKNINENNKLIAEFMGFEKYPIKDKSDGYKVKLKSGSIPMETCIASLKFHLSWDWLMPVVKECTDKTNDFQYDDELYIHWETEIFHPDYMLSEILNNDIEGIYNRVVKFIKWYNEL